MIKRLSANAKLNGWKAEGFRLDGEYLLYEGEFVCRFKYTKAKKREAVKFIRELVEKYSVGEYFLLLEFDYSPLDLLKSKLKEKREV